MDLITFIKLFTLLEALLKLYNDGYARIIIKIFDEGFDIKKK